MIDGMFSLCSKLIKCKSITPEDVGTTVCIAAYLSSTSFDIKVLNFKSSDGKNRTKNLFAKYGTSDKKI